jgi:hypothetical protein
MCGTWYRQNEDMENPLRSVQKSAFHSWLDIQKYCGIEQSDVRIIPIKSELLNGTSMLWFLSTLIMLQLYY